MPAAGTRHSGRVSNRGEENMDLWNALGVSRESALLACGAGLLAALALAARNVLRRRDEPRGGSLRLDDRDS
jgi:hypothetical protein